MKGFYYTRIISTDILSNTQTIFVVVVCTIPCVLKKRYPIDWFKYSMAYMATLGFILIFLEDYLLEGDSEQKKGAKFLIGDGFSLGYSLIFAVYTSKLSEITALVGEENFKYNLFLGF